MPRDVMQINQLASKDVELIVKATFSQDSRLYLNIGHRGDSQLVQGTT